MVICFFISTVILFGVSRLFKISISLKKSLVISLLVTILSSLASVVLGIIGLGAWANVLSLVAGYFIFHYLFKKYYQVSWGRTLGVYLVNLTLTVLITFAIALPIRLFVFEPFVVSGSSMNPHLNQGDYLLIKKYNKNIIRDDIVVFMLPSKNVYLIQRVIGLPTEKIVIKDGQMLINGSPYQNKFIVGKIEGNVDVTLGDDEYFVLGDNAENSAMDSRKIGAIKYAQIVGKVSGQ